MTLRFSTGVQMGLLGSLGFQGLFNRGSINIYSGVQPNNANAAATGTLLGVVTANSLPLTQEVRATGTIVITGGSVSITDITVGGLSIIPGGPVLYNTSTAQTASDACDAINRDGVVTATVSGSTITLKTRPGAGTMFNGETVTSTGSVTATYGGGTMSGGVASVNGLVFAPPTSAGLISKPLPAIQIWSFLGIAAGTAGWFRQIGSEADAGGAIVAAPWLPRVDGTIAPSGADMSLSNMIVAVNGPNTVDRYNMTQPAA